MTATVGIVLVSHSSLLAEGAAEIAGQISGDSVTIGTAGGTDDGHIGTSIAKIQRALSLAVMQLGASTGQQVTVRASGPDAREAVAALIGILAEATSVGG